MAEVYPWHTVLEYPLWTFETKLLDKISIRFRSTVSNLTQNSNTEKSILNSVKCPSCSKFILISSKFTVR